MPCRRGFLGILFGRCALRPRASRRSLCSGPHAFCGWPRAAASHPSCFEGCHLQFQAPRRLRTTPPTSHVGGSALLHTQLMGFAIVPSAVSSMPQTLLCRIRSRALMQRVFSPPHRSRLSYPSARALPCVAPPPTSPAPALDFSALPLGGPLERAAARICRESHRCPQRPASWPQR